jgi:hypothetical protein
MPEGAHWEWRGFGRVSSRLREAFAELPLAFPRGPLWDEIQDEHISIPGCAINAKLRSGGSQQGLKLKRFLGRAGTLELWREEPGEQFPFALFDHDRLARLAVLLEVTLPETLISPMLTPRNVLDLLRLATPPAEIVGVRKRRQTRGFGEHILVEIAEILAVTRDDRGLPVDPSLMSVAVKSRLELGCASRSGIAAARDELRTVLEKLGVQREGLVPRNDLQAITIWPRDPPLVATGVSR